MKATWKGHALQALVESIPKTQALKATWQGHVVQALVEILPKTQASKATWQGHVVQPVELVAKTQVSKTVGQGHILAAQVEMPIIKTQGLKCLREVAQILASWCKIDSRHPFPCTLVPVTTHDIAPSLINICGYTGAGQGRCSFYALLLQGFVQHEFLFHVMQGEL